MSAASGRIWLLPLAYLLWIANGAIALLAVLLARHVLLRLVVVFGWGPWVLGAVDKLGVVFLVLLWLGWVVAAEGMYRAAAWEGPAALAAATRRTMLVAGVPPAVLALVLLALLVLRP